MESHRRHYHSLDQKAQRGFRASTVEDNFTKIFEAQNISVGYSQQAILENINFQIHLGDFVFITGKTGSGKTTFLNFIDSSRGIKILNGQVMRYHENNSSLFKSYIYQGLKVFKDMTVSQNLSLVYDSSIYNDFSEFKESALNYCRVLGIEQHMNKKLNLCNGATSQKVAIIRSILTKPRVILADEPTSSLDSSSSHKVYDLLNLLNHKTKMSIVWVTHDRDLVKKFNGRIFNIEGRKIIDVRRHCFT